METVETFEAALLSLADRDDIQFVLTSDKSVKGRINSVGKDFVSVLVEDNHLVIIIPFTAILRVETSTEPPSA